MNTKTIFRKIALSIFVYFVFIGLWKFGFYILDDVLPSEGLRSYITGSFSIAICVILYINTMIEINDQY